MDERLCDALGTESGYWLALQTDVDDWNAERANSVLETLLNKDPD